MPRLAPGVCLSTLLALGACVALYHDDVGLDGTVRVTAIDATTILISVRGDGSGDIASIKDYALLKGADETLKRGYDHFRIVDSQHVTREQQDASGMDAAYSPESGLRGGGPMGYQSTRFEASMSEGEDILISLIKGPGSDKTSAALYSATDIEADLGPRVRGDAQAPIMARLIPPKPAMDVEANSVSRVRGEPPTTAPAAPSAMEIDLDTGLRIRSELPAATRVAPSRVALAVSALRSGFRLRLGLPINEDTLGPFGRSCNRRELALAAAAQRDGLRYELECR